MMGKARKSSTVVCGLSTALAGLGACAAVGQPDIEPAALTDKTAFKPDDVVAFLGGADVSSTAEGGHLETLLAARYASHGVRFRNLGWEGDTVDLRSRD